MQRNLEIATIQENLPLECLISDNETELKTLTDPKSVTLDELLADKEKAAIINRPDSFDAKFTLIEVINAYLDCRHNKANSLSAINFELDWEIEAYKLWKDLCDGTYEPGPSTVFIVDYPVKREIFAASFRDRVVHHLIYKKTIEIFESMFSDDSYSTRVGRGTLYGINAVEEMIRECSENYTKDCYILGLDIKGFFMSIDKKKLFSLIETIILMYYDHEDRNLLIDTIRKVVFNNPQDNCIRRCPKEKWIGLPPDKSLFSSDGMHGLPIGNLTSQVFALLFLNLLDHIVKDAWGIRYYGRYVDDMRFIDRDKQHLIEVKKKLIDYLASIGLSLHPKKVYLQHYSKGVMFIGGMIKPGRKYVSNRTVGNFYKAIHRFNKIAQGGVPAMMKNAELFRDVMNSYFGILGNFDEKRLTVKMIYRIDKNWYKLMTVKMKDHKCKVVLRKNVVMRLKTKKKENFEFENL